MPVYITEMIDIYIYIYQILISSVSVIHLNLGWYGADEINGVHIAASFGRRKEILT